MKKKQKVRVLLLIVVPLVALAVFTSVRTLWPTSDDIVGDNWKDLTDEEREKRLDEVERKRRALGRGSSGRVLPEDRPNDPKTRPTWRPGRPPPRPPQR